MPRGAWHRVLQVVAWTVLLVFLASVIASSVLGILRVLQ
jgi:hypothetical protein